MQRLNRSTPAPKGAAFLLFLGLAIVPFSLRAAGLQVSFSPNLSAASDAWRQITDVFGSGYQPALEFALSTSSDPGSEQLRTFDPGACSGSEFACARDAGEVSAAMEKVRPVCGPIASIMRGVRPNPALCSRTSSRAAEPAMAATVARDMLQIQVRVHEKLSAVEIETHAQRLNNDELVKIIERHLVDRSLTIPQNLQDLMMLVRLKAPAIPSATKAAQCKVRAALDSAQRVDRERAALTGMPSVSPDNSEL